MRLHKQLCYSVHRLTGCGCKILQLNGLDIHTLLQPFHTSRGLACLLSPVLICTERRKELCCSACKVKEELRSRHDKTTVYWLCRFSEELKKRKVNKHIVATMSACDNNHYCLFVCLFLFLVRLDSLDTAWGILATHNHSAISELTLRTYDSEVLQSFDKF